MALNILPEWLHPNAVLKPKPPLIGGRFWIVTVTAGDSLERIEVYLRETSSGAEQTRTADKVLRDFCSAGMSVVNPFQRTPRDPQILAP